MAIVEQTDTDGPDHPAITYANYYGYGYGGAGGNIGGYGQTATSNAAILAATATTSGTGGMQGSAAINGSPRGVWDAGAARGGGGGADMLAVVRRAKALGVPPLPPNLGAVRLGFASCSHEEYGRLVLDMAIAAGGRRGRNELE